MEHTTNHNPEERRNPAFLFAFQPQCYNVDMTSHTNTFWFARISLFIIYFWFGLLKVLGTSPANPLVEELMNTMLPSFITFDVFIVLFGIFEMIIGILFLISKWDKVTVWLFGLHMFSTFMPLIMTPAAVWQSAFVPNLEGQYIIKNLALISIVLFLFAFKPRTANAPEISDRI